MAEQNDNGGTVRSIFVRGDGSKINFFLHPRLPVPELINLRNRIRTYGGEVCGSEGDAETIIAPLYTDTYKELQERWVLTQTWVESPGFIDQCIEQGSYAHRPLKPKRLTGRAPGGRRAVFSSQDDMHLVEFIGKVLPYKESGGRQGQRVWRMLMGMAIYNKEYSWASRHTAESWKERYRRRQEYFDPLIEEYVKRNPPNADGKGLYPYSRALPIVEHEGGQEDLLSFEEYNQDHEPPLDQPSNIPQQSPVRDSNIRERSLSSTDQSPFKRQRVSNHDDGDVSGERRNVSQGADQPWFPPHIEEDLQANEISQNSLFLESSSPNQEDRSSTRQRVIASRPPPLSSGSTGLLGPPSSSPPVQYRDGLPLRAARRRSALSETSLRSEGVDDGILDSPPKATHALPSRQDTQGDALHSKPIAPASSRPEQVTSPRRRLIPVVEILTPPPRGPDPPYRNTRARARSVSLHPEEPAVVPRKRNPGNSKQVKPAQVVEERELPGKPRSRRKNKVPGEDRGADTLPVPGMRVTRARSRSAQPEVPQPQPALPKKGTRKITQQMPEVRRPLSQVPESNEGEHNVSEEEDATLQSRRRELPDDPQDVDDRRSQSFLNASIQQMHLDDSTAIQDSFGDENYVEQELVTGVEAQGPDLGEGPSAQARRTSGANRGSSEMSTSMQFEEEEEEEEDASMAALRSITLQSKQRLHQQLDSDDSDDSQIGEISQTPHRGEVAAQASFAEQLVGRNLNLRKPPRRNLSTDESDFPSPNTQAREVIERRRREAKPEFPMPGTRAAEMSGTTTRRALRQTIG